MPAYPHLRFWIQTVNSWQESVFTQQMSSYPIFWTKKCFDERERAICQQTEESTMYRSGLAQDWKQGTYTF